MRRPISPLPRGPAPGSGDLDSETLPEELGLDELSMPDLSEAASSAGSDLSEVSEDAVAAAQEPLVEADPGDSHAALAIDPPEEDLLEGGEDQEELAGLDLGAPEDLDPGPAGPLAEEPEPDSSDTQEFQVAGDRVADPAESESQAETEAGDFDLAAALADAFDDDSIDGLSATGEAAESDGLEAVFDAFKKGVSETLGEGDHQAHYDLAIAYKEMGLHDDAIAELELAMADESRQPECLHLIALCALDADRVPFAVEQLGRLLALPELGEEAALAARFELGGALLRVGDREGAREAWTQVADLRPGFQDVEQRLAELGEPGPDDSSETGIGGEEFESFDDIVSSVFEDSEAPPEAQGPTDDGEAPPEAGEPTGVPAEPPIEEAILEAEPLVDAAPLEELQAVVEAELGEEIEAAELAPLEEPVALDPEPAAEDAVQDASDREPEEAPEPAAAQPAPEAPAPEEGPPPPARKRKSKKKISFV